MTTKRNSHLAESADGLGTRYVVAFKQIPGNPTKALVIKLDAMTSTVDRDALYALVWTSNAQRERDFINVLHTNNLLNFYKEKNYFTTVNIDDVVMTPGDGSKIPLRHVLNAINQQQGLAPLPTAEELSNIIDRNPQADRLREEATGTQSNAAIARSVMTQARMLQDEANRKLEEAYALDPTLRPSARVAATPAVQAASVEIVKPTPVVKKTPTKKTAVKKSTKK